MAFLTVSVGRVSQWSRYLGTFKRCFIKIEVPVSWTTCHLGGLQLFVILQKINAHHER